MKPFKLFAFLAMALLFSSPIFSQTATPLSVFLKNLTREQKLQLLEFMRSQSEENLDHEATVLFEKLGKEGQKNTVNYLFNSQKESGTPIRTMVKIAHDSIDFGTVMRGDIVRDSIQIENVGSQPYMISETISNCGCAVADKPDSPILPGEKATIHVQFDTRNILPGPFHRAISIRDNSSPNLRNLIYVVATVIAKDSPPKNH